MGPTLAKLAKYLGWRSAVVATKVEIAWGEHEERFGNVSLQDRLDQFAKPVKWTNEAVSDLQKEFFGDSAEAKEFRERHPWLKKAIFAHVTELKDVTKQGSQPLSGAGKNIVECVTFKLRADDIHFQKGQAGDEKIVYPFSKPANVHVRLERSSDGFIFAFISGYGAQLEPARIQLSRVLTGLKTLQLRRYYFAPAEIEKLSGQDMKGSKLGKQYHWKVDEGGSVLFRDTKESNKMSLSNWLAKFKKRKFRSLEYQSTMLNGEWVELDGKNATIGWTRTDPEPLVEYARAFVVPELIKIRGGPNPFRHSPFI